MRRFIAWKQAVVNRIIKRPWIVGVSQTLAPPFNPADMFTNNEPGWVYDLSDFSTLFQDSAGTIPVTAVEQPVGLVLDKSQGLAIGPDLVTNGDFSNGATGWTLGAGWSIAGGEASVNSGAATNTELTQTFALVSGSLYEFELDYNYTSGVAEWWLGSSIAMLGTTSGHKKRYVLATTTGATILRVRARDPATVFSVDNISVKLLAGNHASQPTTTKMPVLKVDGNGKYYLKGDGVDDFLSTAAIDFTGADSVTIWQGVQKLSDAESGVLCELGAESITLNGTFGLFAPEPAGTGYMFNSRGTSRAFVISPSNPSPHKCVLTAQGRISTDTCAIQINEGVVMTNAADQGINAYTLNPMYFGSRGGASNFFGGEQYSSVGIGKPGVTPEELYNTRNWVNDRTGAY